MDLNLETLCINIERELLDKSNGLFRFLSPIKHAHFFVEEFLPAIAFSLADNDELKRRGKQVYNRATTVKVSEVFPEEKKSSVGNKNFFDKYRIVPINFGMERDHVFLEELFYFVLGMNFFEPSTSDNIKRERQKKIQKVLFGLRKDYSDKVKGDSLFASEVEIFGMDYYASDRAFLRPADQYKGALLHYLIGDSEFAKEFIINYEKNLEFRSLRPWDAIFRILAHKYVVHDIGKAKKLTQEFLASENYDENKHKDMRSDEQTDALAIITFSSLGFNEEAKRMLQSRISDPDTYCQSLGLFKENLPPIFRSIAKIMNRVPKVDLTTINHYMPRPVTEGEVKAIAEATIGMPLDNYSATSLPEGDFTASINGLYAIALKTIRSPDIFDLIFTPGI